MSNQKNKSAAKPNAANPAAATTKPGEGAGAADANLTGNAAAAGAANAGAPGADKAATKKQKVKALQVVAKVERFRRGGHVFSRAETTVKLDELTDEQIKQIKGEPLLTVTEVEVDAE